MESEARAYLFFAFVLLSATSCSSSNVFDNLLGNIEPCNTVCDKTYPLHTYPWSAHLDCCYRGCRFFSLVDIFKQVDDVNVTKSACQASCMEAYERPSDHNACVLGCSSEAPVAQKRRMELSQQEPSLHLLTPFLSFRNLYSGMVDRVHQVISTSWSVYVQDDNGHLMVVQSPPHVVREMVDDEMEYDHDYIDSPSRLTQVPPRHQTQQISTANDWLSCVSRKSGLPRWFLAATIFLSAVVIVWLFFATTATAPDQRVSAEKFSVKADLSYAPLIDIYDEKPKLLLNTQEEAPPLPVKIHMQKV